MSAKRNIEHDSEFSNPVYAAKMRRKRWLRRLCVLLGIGLAIVLWGLGFQGARL
ncbi:hypothetical protein [Hydrogenophaga sp. T2]|uniref:hypothetical protein n=1 Tax=Hydrogenophaga sp. T2 TaxID=3132823 RepID=UPI003CF7C3FE